MTAPDMEGVIAEVLYLADFEVWVSSEPWMSTHERTVRPRYEEEARAVLAAIREAGTVEWGTETIHEKTGAILDRDVWQTEESARSVNRKCGDRVVSRVVTPWTAVEG